MHNVPGTPASEVRVIIDAEEPIVRIVSPGCTVVLTGIGQMTEVCDALASHIAWLVSESRGEVAR